MEELILLRPDESANEVCFKVDGIVCVLLIYKEKPDDKLSELFSELQNYLSPKINRGLKYKFGAFIVMDPL